MIRISACLIVKNEEAVLARCLDSIRDLVDEIVIADTGSTDKTKEIAAQYTDKVYDFPWVQDFAAARNFVFSKAEMEYIYSVDADEVLDDINRKRFLMLKKTLLPEIDIVQMYYKNQLEHNTTYNFDRELRPKLFKRLRTFQWQDPVHESVRLDPVIYDSEIEIFHMPENNHAGRDFDTILRAYEKNGYLSARLWHMYARELFIAGKKQDFFQAYAKFEKRFNNEVMSEQAIRETLCVLVQAAFYKKDVHAMFTYALKNVALGKPSAEVCYILGEYYKQRKEYAEARLWYFNAAFEAESECNVHYGGDYALEQIAYCLKQEGKQEEAAQYTEMAENWEQGK